MLPAVQESAPPHARQQAAPCAKLLAALPVSLGRLAPRIVHTEPDTPYVVAWGAPAVVLSCGAARPADLAPGSSTQFRVVDAVPFDLVLTKSAARYTTVDRAPYIAITFPAGQQPANLLPTLARAIATALPSVCSTDPTTPDVDKLCTRRP